MRALIEFITLVTREKEPAGDGRFESSEPYAKKMLKNKNRTYYYKYTP
jgi:hypothetical protein